MGAGAGGSVPDLPSQILVAPVAHLREHASTIADRFFGAPSRELSVAGITGTNGKTTCAYLLAQALESAGRPAAYMGTIGTGRPRALAASALTTGDAVTVQRTLARLKADGAGSVAMEVSSHAIDQWRVGAVRFRTAAFTNLTRDHLDYHGSMESYAATKARLFTRDELESRVINVDDPAGRQLAIDPRGRGRLVVTSRGHQSHTRAAAGFVRAMHIELSPQGIELEFDSSWGSGALTSALVGDFNVENLLTVIAILLDWGLTPDQATQALGRVRAAPGRMETFGGGAAPLAVVDYAHTPDALRKALQRGARTRQGPAGRGVRLRRRSRSGQAAAHGRDCRRARRRHRHHRRQSAQRIAVGHHRRYRHGNSRRTRHTASSTIAAQPFVRLLSMPAATTWC